ncbi:hypothetical protein CRX67_09250 [Enterobacteriaceae bacterium A-F18]|jgi:hypothetical protein|nr:hypothetical protein [Phytobacter diazotrophicus]QIH63291.1 hypothetical protein CRX67_09250 [Enterobacteriaceae bacterium A-F18]
MQIELSFLEKIVNTIFLEMKRCGMDSVPLDEDFYWNIPSESLFDPYNEPNQLDIGQLAEDYEILRLAHSQHSLVSHNLKNVSALMRFLSEKYPF